MALSLVYKPIINLLLIQARQFSQCNFIGFLNQPTNYQINKCRFIYSLREWKDQTCKQANRNEPWDRASYNEHSTSQAVSDELPWAIFLSFSFWRTPVLNCSSNHCTSAKAFLWYLCHYPDNIFHLHLIPHHHTRLARYLGKIQQLVIYMFLIN